jgi:hypothetical protein
MGVRALEPPAGSNLIRVSDMAQKVFEVVKKQPPVGDPQIVPLLLPRAKAAAAVLAVQVAWLENLVNEKGEQIERKGEAPGQATVSWLKGSSTIRSSR